MSTRSANWVALRAMAWIAIALPLCRGVMQIQADYLFASVWLVPSVLALAMAATCFVLQYQRMIPGSLARWRRPNWFENPLARHQPLQWSLLLGEVLMLAGLGCAFVDVLAATHQCRWELPMASGIGVWLGTYLFGEFCSGNAHR
ncbi:hypothetical protein [Dyella caseinilytica]|uniref:Uncharacterized protein n=1 Tax=Dyella caseinilytica TaxID=1849581 RepID=A0ABX7GZ11_9GAMM|nr:hypothetical protein [Dyella caseinilytica]QRN55529.1 hypothetical protein ISN74_09505 [Dyella caseinilytica]